LLYSLLHLSGFDVSINALKFFRQQGSKTLVHPEVTDTEEVGAKTESLRQGLATSVSMFLGSVLKQTTAYKKAFFEKMYQSVLRLKWELSSGRSVTPG